MDSVENQLTIYSCSWICASSANTTRVKDIVKGEKLKW